MNKGIRFLFPTLIYEWMWEMGVEEGDGTGDGKGAGGDVQQQLATVNARLATLEAENKTLKDGKVDLEQRLEEADKELLSEDYLDFKEKKGKEGSGGGKTGGDTTDSDGIDLDRASNREIAQFIEKKYKGDLSAAVKDIKSQFDATKQQIGMIAAQFDVALTSLRHDGRDGKLSFAEHQKEIFEIAKANPKWGAEQCYQQFLLQSKAAADEKAEADRKKAEEEAKAATERTGVPGSMVQEKRLSAEEAAELAYQKAFGNKG